MRGRSFIIRCATLLLLIVFSQKMGAGLLLHNLLHARSATSQTDGSKEISFACNCIDDFSMPFTETEEQVLPVPVLSHVTAPVFVADRIPFTTPVFSSLRGPPSCIL